MGCLIFLIFFFICDSYYVAGGDVKSYKGPLVSTIQHNEYLSPCSADKSPAYIREARAIRAIGSRKGLSTVTSTSLY